MKQRDHVPPIVTIITDSISVHGIWVSSPSDLYCVADEETRVVVEKLGAPADRIRITGFPVSLQFTETGQRPPMSSDKGRILYLPSTSLDYVRQTLEALRPLIASGVELTLPLGKHADRLDPIVRPFMTSLPEARITLIGWTEKMPELLQTHDVVICKAGGAILHEVLAARCPAVIDYVVPGQEEGNAEYLLSHHCALRSHTPQETADCVARILADGGQLGREFREAMIPISLPDAAMRAAKEALSLCPVS
jgi:processive 1,2-diacylglycerol beta-glucosyltransferase